MQTIQLNDTIFNGPEKWNDLTRENLLVLAKCIGYTGKPDLVNYVLVCELFGIGRKWRKLLRRSHLDQMAACLDFLLEENSLNKWLIPSISAGMFTYYGPKDRLADLTAMEFVQIEAYYERYVHTEKEEYLDGLIASLYRRKSFFSHGRVAFSDENVAKLAKEVASLPKYVKTAIYTNYTGCRNLIIRLHPNLFLKGGTGESGSAAPQYIAWNTHLIGVAGGPLGDYEAVKKQNVWIVLKHMDDMAAAQRRTK